MKTVVLLCGRGEERRREERRGEERGTSGIGVISNDVVDGREVTESDSDKCSCPSPPRPSHHGLNLSL